MGRCASSTNVDAHEHLFLMMAFYVYYAEQAANPNSSGTTSRHIGNPSHDTGTPAQVCSRQITNEYTGSALNQANQGELFHVSRSKLSTYWSERKSRAMSITMDEAVGEMKPTTFTDLSSQERPPHW